ncbi:MAG: hypothetical protein AAF098_16880 [Pseudomonadota bacterium]
MNTNQGPVGSTLAMLGGVWTWVGEYAPQLGVIIGLIGLAMAAQDRWKRHKSEKPNDHTAG